MLRDLKRRIEQAQVRGAVVAVNRELVLLYWNIGRDILIRQQQQGWGAKVIDGLATDLRRVFPEKGFSLRNLKYMRAFADAYADEQFVQQPVAQTPWFRNLILMSEQHLPDIVWLIRHGESAGNVARDLAEAAGDPVIKLATRDVDVPLSTVGEHQAAALGRWFGDLQQEDQPTVILTSPYLRARRTAEIALAASGLDSERILFIRDERLREKEFGIFDRLTKSGAQEKYPEQAEVRTLLGNSITGRRAARVGAM
ncbi:MAG: DUF1016 N-terminal domain-containing protein [Pyrinomonadaceae bacterium]